MAPRGIAALREAFVRHYLEAEFVGREAELDHLDRWLAASEADGPRLCLLTAPAGRGKSALITRWVEALRNRARFPVLFVPVSNRFHTNRPDVVLPALAAELSAVLGVTVEFPAVGAVEAYRDILVELLDRFTGTERRCLLVIDGLDETLLAGWELGRALLPAAPPLELRILVTARRLAGDAGAAGWRTRLGWGLADVTELDLGALARPSVATLLARITLEERPGLADRDLSELTYQVFRLSDEGDPLLVELYATDIRDALRSGLDDTRVIGAQLSRRSAGLRGYFENWMQERHQSFSASDTIRLVPLEVAEATLVLLASALGPLRHDELVALLQRVIPDETIPPRMDLLRPLARFILGDGETIGYTLGHPRFTVFLLEEQYVGTPLLERATAAFLEWGDEVIDELALGHRRLVANYLLAWYPWHLLRDPAIEPARLSRLLSRAWVEASRIGGGEAGFALAAQAVLDRLLESIDQAAGTDAVALGAALRASLFLASLREAANFSDPSLLSLAFEAGVLDQGAIEARLPLLPSVPRVELLLELARSTRSGSDAPVFWRQARDLAVAEQSESRTNLLGRVLQESRAFDDPPPAENPISWDEAMAVLREQLATPVAVSPSVLRWLPFPWHGSLREPKLTSIPAMRLRELARLLLEVHIEPGPLVARLRAVAETYLRFSGKGVADDASCPVRALRAFVELLCMDDAPCGPIATVLNEVLDGLEEPTASPATRLQPLRSLQLGNDRLAAVAAVLALLAALQGPNDVIAALLEPAEERPESGDFAQLVAASPLDELPGGPRELIAGRAWTATRAAHDPTFRTYLRIALAEHETVDLAAASEAISEEISSHGRIELLIALGHRLATEQLRSLLLELSASTDPESLGHIVDRIIRRAPAESRRRLLEDELASFVHRPDSDSAGGHADAAVEREVESFLRSEPEERSKEGFERAVQHAHGAVSRRTRARLLTYLAREAPATSKAAIVKEALAEAGTIDDRDVSLQAMAQLASGLPPGTAEPMLAGLLAALSKLEPQAIVDTAANCAWRLPAGVRPDWAACAIAAARTLPVGSLRAAQAMARVVNSFRDDAPKTFGATSLRSLATLGPVGGRGVGDAYRDLVFSRPWASWPAIVQGLRGAQRMSPEGRAALLCAIVARHPRLFFWVRSTALAAVSTIPDGTARLNRLMELVRSSRGRRRQSLLDRACDEFIKLLDKSEESRLWVSEYHPVRSLFEAVDPGTRDKIRHEIEGRSSPGYAELYESCVFPTLSPEEREQAGPRLLAAARAPLPSPLAWEARFRQLCILFLHWEGERSRRPLLELLRVGASISRRDWLYGIPDVVGGLPDEVRPEVASVLSEAIADGTALWP